MKTTIELPDELFLQVKRHAFEQGTTIKALIESGLRLRLQDQAIPRQQSHYYLPVISQMARGHARDDVNALIDAVRDESIATLRHA
jgi:hypothetical protein